MKIGIFSIAKQQRTDYDPIYKDLTKMISRFAEVETKDIFHKQINQAHSISTGAAKHSYTQAFEPYFDNSYSIALHPDGKIIDSFAFSKLIDGKMSIKFFIGGAYGLEEEFLDRCDSVISLGKITMSHKIAKVVLLEQIYRGFSILSGHPYHK
jgi:23S rRNA (pseudouridine1915-N3)-methyltransferase